MFAESEMIAAMNGRPSVVFPSVCSWMRGLDFESAVKYATTCDHSGSLRSVPGAKPITDAGVGICAGACNGFCAPSSDGAPSARAIAMRRSDRCNAPRAGLGVDFSELVRGLEHVADLARERARLDGCAVDVADGRLHTG
jgi:hypothetical protein